MGYHLDRLKMAMGGAVKGYAGGGSAVGDQDLDGIQLALQDAVKNPFQPGVAATPAAPAPIINTANYPRPERMPIINAANYPRPPQMTLTRETAPTPVINASNYPRPATVTTPGAKPAGAPGISPLVEKYYGSGESVYAPELEQARRRVSEETEQFNKMLTGMMAQGEQPPSKAEMYFRLAAAFGEPTKTGEFGESLSKAGQVMAEHAKDTRAAKTADKQLRMQLALEAQKLKMQGVKEELGTLRTLSSEEMKDKRAIATEMIKQYIKSGEPESSAGKQAKDEGLTPGTPEYQKRVKEIADTNIEKQMAGITSQLANLTLGQANLALNQQKFSFQKEQAGKLTPGEVKMKTEAEDNLASIDQALKDLSQAYKLNPNTFDLSLVDIAQQKLLESFGSKDPKVLATRTQANLLSKQGVAKLKATFGGNPTEGERKILLDLEGIGSKSKEERAAIMRNAYSALKARRERENKRLNEINQGLYRETTPAPGGLE